MLPYDLKASQFVYILRKRLKMLPSDALFVMCGNRMLVASEEMGRVFANHRDKDDGFLYVTYTCENAFGWAHHARSRASAARSTFTSSPRASEATSASLPRGTS